VVARYGRYLALSKFVSQLLKRQLFAAQ